MAGRMKPGGDRFVCRTTVAARQSLKAGPDRRILSGRGLGAIRGHSSRRVHAWACNTRAHVPEAEGRAGAIEPVEFKQTQSYGRDEDAVERFSEFGSTTSCPVLSGCQSMNAPMRTRQAHTWFGFKATLLFCVFVPTLGTFACPSSASCCTPEDVAEGSSNA